jgi:hypothetical protein
MWNYRRPRIYLFFLLVVVCCLSLVCILPADDTGKTQSQVRSIAAPYRFKFVLWEARALTSSIDDVFVPEKGMDEETILHNQVETIIKEHELVLFPPFNFSLEKPPHLLVISPRERIVYWDRMLLRQYLTVEEKEAVEEQVDQLGVSSLVTEIGGLGSTIPPIVTDDASLEFTIDAIVEEWLHQYLSFRPLGFNYLLYLTGLKHNPDIATMNESLAGLVSKEIGDEVYRRYYDTDIKKGDKNTVPRFDFSEEMRITRKNVDIFLAEGDIEKAESYMEARRRLFVLNGYNIRKLNQAYFAFHGIYGYDPASVSPIYKDLKELRERSPSLKQFLDRTAAMTSYDDLKKALEE